MSEEEKVDEAEKLGLPKGNPSALGKITTAGYASLELIRYFTCQCLLDVYSFRPAILVADKLVDL